MKMRARWKLRGHLADLDATTPGALAFARGHLRDDDQQARLLAIKAIGRIDPVAARNDLLELASSEDVWDRRIALEVLRKTAGRAVWPLLMESYKDPDSSISFDAFLGLQALAGPGDMAELFALADAVNDQRAQRIRMLVDRLA